MNPNDSSPAFLHASMARLQPWAIDFALIAVVVFIPNFLLGLHVIPDRGILWPTLSISDISIPPARAIVLLLSVNLVILGLLFSLRQMLVLPLKRITRDLEKLGNPFALSVQGRVVSPLNMQRLASDISRFANFAMEHYRNHLESARELAQARQIIQQFSFEHDTMIGATAREIATQYHAVLSYAHYLDEQILNKKLDPSLRHDLDDICESSFNLKLITGVIGMLRTDASPALVPIALSELMEQTMEALTPALDRRAMKLSRAEIDDGLAAMGDVSMLSHCVWMMLLGIIRYAADESSLRIRCLPSHDGLSAMASIVISELPMARIAVGETAEHVAAQMHHLTPHLFAQTIRAHGNTELADLLMQRIHGRVTVYPLTVSSCEICIELPTAILTHARAS